MKATDIHTCKDTVGSVAVLLAILLSTLCGAYIGYADSTLRASVSINTEA